MPLVGLSRFGHGVHSVLEWCCGRPLPRPLSLLRKQVDVVATACGVRQRPRNAAATSCADLRGVRGKDR
eukprot:1106278-Pyramimonas_sp.AAC.1